MYVSLSIDGYEAITVQSLLFLLSSFSRLEHLLYVKTQFLSPAILLHGFGLYVYVHLCLSLCTFM